MQTVTSFPASAVPRDQLGGILADYLALDRARIVRRRLVMGFGPLALLAAVAAAVFPRVSPLAPWFAMGLFLLPPAFAWIAEIRLEWRLSRRLEDIDGATSHKELYLPGPISSATA